MKIGIDARMISATGIGRYTKSLIENLAFVDEENDYFLFLKKDDFDTYKVPASNFKKVLADFHWYGISEQLKFPKIINDLQLDLVHFPHFNIPIFYKGRFITTIHDLTLHKYKTNKASTKNFLTYQIKHLLYKIIIKKAINKSEIIICPSKFTKRDILEQFKISEDKIIVTYEGGPSEKLKSTKPDTQVFNKYKITKPYVLYVGNAYPHKNLPLVLDSVKYLPGDIKIVLAGKDDYFYERLRARAKEEGLLGRVIFTGFVTDEELVGLYKDALAYVFPSLNEGFGLPPLEAINFKLPPVVANSSCLPEILGKAALYFDPSDANELADSIKMILDDNSTRLNIIENGQKILKDYSWRKMAQETHKIYQGAVR